MLERSKNIFSIFQIFKIFFEKWPQWDITNVERKKVMNYELNRSVHRGVMRGNLLAGAQSAPPRVK